MTPQEHHSKTPVARLRPDLRSGFIKKSWTLLATLALVPVLIMVAFTFKSGFTPSRVKDNKQSIVVLKTPGALAEEATEALRNHDQNTFNDLLDNEIRDNINLVNGRGDTLLMAAVATSNVEAVERLLALGADVNKPNAFTRDTAIIRSLLAGKDEITHLLVLADANLNTENNYKQSPMSLAIEKKKAEFIDLFLTNGVRTGLNKQNLLRAAASKNYIGVVAMLKGGIDPNVADAKGNTPLIFSATYGDAPTARELLAYRAQINTANLAGDTALMFAARYNHLETLKILLTPQLMQYAIDLNMQNKDGQTALYFAASNGYAEAIMRLLAAGADASVKTKNGLTALDIAKKNRRKTAIETLEMNLTDIKNKVIDIDNAAILAKKAAQEASQKAVKKTAAPVNKTLKPAGTPPPKPSSPAGDGK